VNRNAYLQALGITPWRLRDPTPDNLSELPVDTKQSGEVGNVKDATASEASQFTQTNRPHSELTVDNETLKQPETFVASQQIDTSELSKMDLMALRATVNVCTLCEIHQTRKQTVFGEGHHKADWFIVTEAPSADEEREGKAFVGPSGVLLTQMLRAIGLTREEVFITNIIKCRTLNNRDPLSEEIHACGHYLQRQIEYVGPKIILCLGRVAAHALLETDVPVSKIRGQTYTYEKYADIPLMVTYHPAYLLRSPKEKIKVWEDLKLARSTFMSVS